MNYAIESFSKQLKQARIDKNLSQRDLSKLSGVPQSHISKIESNQVDLRLSSFIALANALGLDLALVPHIAMPAIKSISKQLSNPGANSSSNTSFSYPKPAYTLNEDDD